MIGAENLTYRISTPVSFHVNGTLSLFVSASNPENVKLQDIHTEGPYSVLTELISSAERPAPRTRRPAEWLGFPRNAIPKEATPLWNDFIDNVPAGDEQNSLMNYIAHKCFYNDLLHINEDGEWLENPMSLSYKMERLLMVCKRQREVHITRLRSTGDPRCSAERPADDLLMIFNDDDMKTIYNTWRADVHSYMKEATLAAYETMLPQQAHQLTKTTHSAYLFHLSGCKWLLRELLRLPLTYGPTQTPTSSAARPAWHHLLSAFEEHKNSAEYRKAVQNSQYKGDNHVRISKRLWWARHDREKGKNISFKVHAGNVEFDSLNQSDQRLAEDYESGRSDAKLNDLMKEKEENGTTNFHLLRMNS